MTENVNVRIIKKIKDSTYKENVKKFLIDLIREEYAKSDLQHWKYQELYEKKIEEYLEE
jgi:hypothetical protein